MKTFFLELYEYNHQVNRLSMETIAGGTIPFQNTLNGNLNHILLAHRTWNLRMQQKPGLAELWSGLSLAEMFEYDQENLDTSRQLLELHAGTYDLDFTYTNTRGATYTAVFKDIFFHIINHSTYHRGQLNIEIRRAGLEPVVNDFPFYRRRPI